MRTTPYVTTREYEGRDYTWESGKKSSGLKVPLTLSQLRVILDAMDQSRRALCPPGGQDRTSATKTFHEAEAKIKHAIDVIRRRQELSAKTSKG